MANKCLSQNSKKICNRSLIVLVLHFLLVNFSLCDSQILNNDIFPNYGESKKLDQEISDKIFSEMVIEIEDGQKREDRNESTLNSTVLLKCKVNLYNDLAFQNGITKFKIASNKFFYFDYSEIKDRLIIRKNETFSYNLTVLDNYLKSKFEMESERSLILMMDNLEFFQLILTYSYNNKITKLIPNFNYDAVIYHNDSSPLNLILQDIGHPAFEVDAETFESLKKFIDSKIKISITYDNTFSLMPMNFLRITSYISLIILSIFFLWWHFISLQLFRENFQHIQKILTTVIYLKLFISFLLFSYLNVIDSDLKSQNYFEEVFLITSAVTANTIYKTLLLFTIILLSNGWKIITDSFSREKLKKLVAIYLIIYFSLCFDQMIDVSGGKNSYFLPSEIKNIIMLAFLGVYVLKNSRENLRFLKEKLIYAFEYSTDHVNSLRLKILILFSLSVYSVLYCFLFSFINCMVRIYLGKYERYIQSVSLINSNNLDIFFLIFLMYIFRARKFPEHFYMYYLNGEETTPRLEKKPYNVYVASVDDKQYKHSTDLKSIENKNIYKKNKNAPIVIINPMDKLEKFEFSQICISYISE